MLPDDLKPHYSTHLTCIPVGHIDRIDPFFQIFFRPDRTVIPIRVVHPEIGHAALNIIAVDYLEMISSSCGAQTYESEVVTVEHTLDVQACRCSIDLRCEAVGLGKLNEVAQERAPAICSVRERYRTER